MKKIPSLFQRDYHGIGHFVRDEVVPGSEWVIAGEGIATRKWDGTCVLIEGGKLFKRYEVKKGKTPPEGFVPANRVDENTGKQQGWLPVGDGPDDKWHRETFERYTGLNDGTYELVGPKVNGNPEDLDTHYLTRHGVHDLPNAPRTFGALRDYLMENHIEGIVWHRDNGDMVKIKAKDFGIKRGE